MARPQEQDARYHKALQEQYVVLKVLVYAKLTWTLQPLADIFTSNRQLSPSPTSKTRFQKPASTFQVAEDKENETGQRNSPPKHSEAPKHVGADSGYHELADNELASPRAPTIPPKSPLRSPVRSEYPQAASQDAPEPLAQQHRDTDDSFVSANEAPASKTRTESATQETELMTQEENWPEEPTQGAEDAEGNTKETDARQSHPFSVSAETDTAMHEAAEYVERTSPRKEGAHEKPSSPSDTSSPDRPLIRKKSSINLASLPPRDPLTTKRSIGTQGPQNSFRDSSHSFSAVRESYLSRNKQSQGRELFQTADDVPDDDLLGTDDETKTQPLSQSESTKLHSKTSTQRLHERITMLGKSNAARSSKSTTSAIANAHAGTRKTDQQDLMPSSAEPEAMAAQKPDEGANPVSQDVTNHTQLDTASRLNSFEEGAAQPQAPVAIAPYPNLNASIEESTTPAGSPTRWGGDGPLSASKAKFQSFLRSAKGMFASSAAASAQAKMEAMSPAPSRPRLDRQPASIDKLLSMEKADERRIGEDTTRKRSISNGPLKESDQLVPEEPPTKRRTSSRLSERRAQQAAYASNSDMVPPVPPANQSSPAPRSRVAPISNTTEDVSQNNEPKEVPKSITKPVKASEATSKVGEPRRPKQVGKTNAVQKSKPGQFSVLVPSMRPQAGTNNNSVKPPGQQQSSSVVSSSRPALTKKASDSSMRSVSSQSTRPGTANSKLKALENARRKKEQDEREQQRKEEQKKALERKRAEKAEEERQAQERKVAEQKREAEMRAAAQKRALEQQKIEKQQKEEQLRTQAEVAKTKQANDWMSKSQNERPQIITTSKTEKIPVRPESRGQGNDRPLVPHINPAKPPKRYFNPDADDQRSVSVAPQPPIAQQGPKKQKTSEEFELRTQQQPLARTAMGAPVRASVAKKQEPPPRFQQGFMSNTASAQTNSSSMLKTAINTSHQIQQQPQHPKTPHSIQDIAKFANARIPFAEAPNPPGPPQQTQSGYSQQHQLTRPIQKTPGTAKSATKSSPAYPNGDNISLPDIATDSEDEDSDENAFEAPAWTQSPELRQLLEQQQLVDPMKVFGPIAPLSMEDVFKGASKDRMKRFRDRTSSANWNGPDRLTEEERKKDREARERLEREGGWTYEGSIAVEKAQR